ncbi:hypothetical protein [Mycolicibacterium houstonense]|uniref:hypothetical protein n=1 Tax=Mycolicibacterium houstonense TaxID=146021 RepID=UPI00093F5BAE|nr:hypothetical protein [Mycolicibacterium houstonense]
MSDPAIEAAQRAVKLSDPTWAVDSRYGGIAAREMAKPIRELHKPIQIGDSRGLYSAWCAECNGSDGHPSEWPCDTAKAVYSTEELA